MALLLETNLGGDLVIDLDVEGSPLLCRNLLALARARFYTSTLITDIGCFCRCGDPVGDGTGGTSIYGLANHDNTNYHASPQRFLADTAGRPLSAAPEDCVRGRVVAMGQPGIPHTLGSQFGILLQNDGARILQQQQQTTLRSLGWVVEDTHGVLDKIQNAYVDAEGRPYADIRIRRALVVYDPWLDTVPNNDTIRREEEDDDDTAEIERIVTGYWDRLQPEVQRDATTGRVTASPSPERPLEEMVPKRISAEQVMVDVMLMEEQEDDDATTHQDVQKQLAAKEHERSERIADHSRAVVLELLGDIPDADAVAGSGGLQPPENVLFICKLHPETMDEDLELIFARFDEKVSVEVIRDPDTGSSLQYAFAEFTTKAAAEEAYLKMNNALVDDRRIKVDFSQSVAKIWDRYRQRLRMPASQQWTGDTTRKDPSSGKSSHYQRRHRGSPPAPRIHKNASDDRDRRSRDQRDSARAVAPSYHPSHQEGPGRRRRSNDDNNYDRRRTKRDGLRDQRRWSDSDSERKARRRSRERKHSSREASRHRDSGRASSTRRYGGDDDSTPDHAISNRKRNDKEASLRRNHRRRRYRSQSASSSVDSSGNETTSRRRKKHRRKRENKELRERKKKHKKDRKQQKPNHY